MTPFVLFTFLKPIAGAQRFTSEWALPSMP